MKKVTWHLLFPIIVVAAALLCVGIGIFSSTRQETTKIYAQTASSTDSANLSSVQNLFSRVLALGDSGQDVLLLQQILNKNPNTEIAATGIGSPGKESSYFGAQTRAAVAGFQEKYGVGTLSNVNGSIVGTGIADTPTEERLSALYVANIDAETVVQTTVQNPTSTSPTMTIDPTTSVGKPRINNISPSDVYEGDTITITGTGFDASNTITSTFDKFPMASSTDGKTIKLTVHSLLEQQLNKKLDFIKDSELKKETKKAVLLFMQKDFGKSLFFGIPFEIKVENAGGVSNTVTIYYRLN
jgi:peptidoglycan hydrolase-like protein with peptidoglycan-binding domain